MAATRDDIEGWLVRGKREGATHVIVVCDTFDWDDYPVYVQSGEQVQEKMEEYNGKNMQKIMEVYNLSLDIETQLKERRAWNL